MIGRTRELEYLVRVYTDALRAGTVKGFARKASARVQRFAGGNTGSSGLRNQWELWTEGNQLKKKNKRQDALAENGHKQWEFATRSEFRGVGVCRSENHSSITSLQLLFHTG